MNKKYIFGIIALGLMSNNFGMKQVCKESLPGYIPYVPFIYVSSFKTIETGVRTYDLYKRWSSENVFLKDDQVTPIVSKELKQSNYEDQEDTAGIK